jgi:predicted DsbA family dithiol-disulfide isomerase
MADVCITEFTDPACPWAWSAEPFRRRLAWHYGDRLEWRLQMVGLSETPQDNADRGLTPESLSSGYRKIAADHGMPIDTAIRPRVPASVPACRAIVATQMKAPAQARRLLRRLRVLGFGGALIDEPETIAQAAREAGLDPGELGLWIEMPEVEEQLREGMKAARRPMPAARVLDHKLANWSGGRRYTCPSLEITRLSDGVTISVPGFQPFAAYDVVLANLVPGLDRHDAADSVEQVLRWAEVPLASQEVACVCCISRDQAREELGRVAEEQHLGADGFWTLL